MMMQILDFSGVMLASILRAYKEQPKTIDVNLIRHVILSTIKFYNKDFRHTYGKPLIACDTRNGTWRRDFFPHYKIKRSTSRPVPPEVWTEIMTAMDQVKNEIKEELPYPVIEVPKAEGDDVIAVISKSLSEPTVIISNDKDFNQLICSTIHQYRPLNKTLIKKPESSVACHIIQGDAGDGIPNMLSDDDTFAVSGKRQIPLTAKYRHGLLAEFNNLSNPNNEFNKYHRNLIRNQTLIDFNHIPESLAASILHEFRSQTEDKQGKGYKYSMMGYLIKHKMDVLKEQIDQF